MCIFWFGGGPVGAFDMVARWQGDLRGSLGFGFAVRVSPSPVAMFRIVYVGSNGGPQKV